MLRIAVIAVALSVLLLACGAGAEVTTAAADEAGIVETVRSPEGLDCLVTDEMDLAEHEAGMADPGSGTRSVREGADDFWNLGDGALRPDKGTLTEEIDGSTARYRNDAGHVRLILRFELIGDRWLLSSSASCFTAAEWADGPTGGADGAGGGIDGPVVYAARPDGFADDESEIRGVLELRAGCLYLVDGTSESVVLWELGTEWESGAVVLSDGTTVRPGDTVRGTGGYHRVDQSGSFTASPNVQAALDDCAGEAQIGVAVLQGGSIEVEAS